jgi:hypothetical protein
MNPIWYASLFAGALLLGMLALLELGRRLGTRRLAQDPEGARAGAAAVEGAVFALLGLLIAFTFSGAASRFDTRRQLIIEEANDIGTAWLRIDLLPSAAQPPVRDAFRRYVDSRIAVYRHLPDIQAAKAELSRGSELQKELWNQAVTASRETPNPAAMLLLPALNQMFDIATTRSMAAETHPPMIVFAILALLALTSSLFAGFGMTGGKTRSWIHILGFAMVLALTVYVIVDVEFPRFGLVQVRAFDHVLVELRQSMQ